MTHRGVFGVALLCTTALAPLPASGQSASAIAATKLLLPFSQLLSTPEGQQALDDNLATAIAINNNSTTAERNQAIHDYTIDTSRGTTLADGLGPKLQNVFYSAIYNNDPRVGPASSNFAQLTLQMNAVTLTDSGIAKNFYGSGTVDGYPNFTPFSGLALPPGGQYNVYDKAYGPLVPPQETNLSGNSRPYEVAPDQMAIFSGPTFVAPTPGGSPSSNPGPVTSNAELNSVLGSNAAFPSGHTTYGFTTSLMFANMVPELYQEMMTRASEYGYSRVVLGAHYPLDVMGGRIVATYEMAQMLNNNPDFLNQPMFGGTVTTTSDFKALFAAATADLRAVLEEGCGTDLATCARESVAASRFSNYEKNRAHYLYRMTYGLAPVGDTTLAAVVPDGAEVLLATRFPYLSDAQRREVLYTTEIESGHALDDGSGWARLNLFDAAGGYGALRADTHVTMDAAKGGFNAADTWMNDIGGPGRLVKDGSGVLSLYGNNSFGGVDVQGGGLILLRQNAFSGASSVGGGSDLSAALLVSGSLSTTALTVKNNGTLLGGGVVTAPVTVESGGTIAAGDGAVGQLSINGNLTLKSGSHVETEMAAGAADKVVVSGTAQLGGQVDVISGTDFKIGDQFAIVSAAGGRIGTFNSASWNQDYMFLAPELAYDANAAYVSIDRNAVAFASVATSGNGASVANALEFLGPDNAAWDALARLNSVADANAAFNALSGEIHASTRSVLIERSTDVRDAVIDRLRDEEAFGTGAAAALAPSGLVTKAPVKAVAAPAPAYSFWGQGYDSFGRIYNNGNSATAKQNTGGFLTGVDARFNDWVVGIAGGYSNTDIDVDARNSSASSDNYTGAIYAGGRLGQFALRLGAAYTYSDVSTTRSVVFPGYYGKLSSGQDLSTAQIFGEAGYDMAFGQFALEPFAGIAYVNLHGDSFTEQFGAAALTGTSDTDAVTYTTLGLRGSSEFSFGGATYRALLGVGWRHAFGDVDPQSALAFAAGSPVFLVDGAPIAEDAAVLEAGLGAAFSPTARLDITYKGQLASDAADNSVKGTFRLRF